MLEGQSVTPDPATAGVQLTDITYPSLEYVCMNLRACDREEIFALRNHDNPLQLACEAHAAIRNLGRGRVAWYRGRPAAIGAFTQEWRGVWSAWMFGTDDFKASLVPLVRWMRNEANAILSVCEGHRCHCDSRADHTEAHKLIQALGGRREFTMRRYGKDKSDFIRFVWLNGEDNAVLEPHYVRSDK